MRFVFSLLAVAVTAAPASAVELQQVLSREHPAISGTGQGLAVGRTGVVCVYGVKDHHGYVLQFSVDGRQTKFGVTTTYAITGVAVNAEGVVATSNAHFATSVGLYNRTGKELGKVEGFTGNDAVGWDGPGTLECGASGDFFALDQHAGRIVRIAVPGQLVRSYPLRAEGEKPAAKLWSYGFRLHEKSQQFYFVEGAEIVCRGFDGTKRWAVPSRVGGDPWGGFSGGFDVDDEGRLTLCDGDSPRLRVFSVKGEPLPDVELHMGSRTPTPQKRITHLRLYNEFIIVRQKSETEVFQVYERATGKFVRSASIDHEKLSVTFDSYVWTAGKPVPFSIRYFPRAIPVNADGTITPPNPPRNFAWIRPLGTTVFKALPTRRGEADVPADASGLYHLRVTSGVEGSVSDYLLETVVEIRPENAIGSLSVLTPRNRQYYARGEAIPFRVIARTTDPKQIPKQVTVSLRDSDGKERLSLTAAGTENSDSVFQGTLATNQSKALVAGSYRLSTSLAGWTIAEQLLEIGEGFQPRDQRFLSVRYGDYSMAFPTVHFFDAPEKVSRHLHATRTLGENLMVDRLGHSGGGGLHELPGTLKSAELTTRLTADPIAVAPEKAEFENRIVQTVAGYGAHGIEQRGILLYMDAGLPIGTGFDQRPPAQLEKDVAAVTQQFADFPAFGGWSWAANWWIAKRGGAMAETPEEKTAYESAYKTAQETGRWNPILEKVSDRWIGHAVEAEQKLHAALNAASPSGRKLVSGITAPYRQPGILPGTTFRNADEVDLHFQAEQIQWPMISAHNVDFYKRPGKPAWGHPELWNDDGTGGQILSNLLQMAMRGANGVGQSGSTKGFSPPESDPRGMGPGATSIHRQLNQWLSAYGPWLSKLESRDPVAIPVSARMMRMELGWQGVGGFYFTRLFEAYNSCLRSHRPVTFVFAEDCRPNSFANFAAVLLVSQTVELEPALMAALQKAKSSGVSLYTDATTRPSVVESFAPTVLPIEFTRVEKLPHALNDDGAFWHYREIVLDHAAKLNDAWNGTIAPVAECPHPEVLLTERELGDIRVLWAVNDAAVPLEPAHLWRVSLAAGSRFPVTTTVKWPVDNCRIFELFSGQELANGTPLTVDLRHAPARIFVAVPMGSKFDPTEIIPASVVKSPEPKREPFAARLRDIAVSDDQRTALVTAAGWDRNAFLVDLATGAVQEERKIGHHFTYAPQSVAGGFFVQGYDLNSAEGYHLYRLPFAAAQNKKLGVMPDRRFALYGLPKRGSSWASARQWQEPINQFAVSPDGQWIATAGDLGLIVWKADGAKAWSDDWWKSEDRARRRLLALDAKTLLTIEGFTATAVDSSAGQLRWTVSAGPTGTMTAAAASTDGQTVALHSTADGGRIFVVRNGKLLNSVQTAVSEFTVSPDGNFLAVTTGDQFRLFDVASGLLWSAVADDVLRTPRFSPDSQHVVVGSELGTLLVYEIHGRRKLEKDCGALPVASWTKEGGLMVATWLGQLVRLDSKFETVWTTGIRAKGTVAAETLLERDATPTSRVTGWGNAEPVAAELTPNLLKETEAIIEARCDPTTHGDPRTWQHKIDLLRDGNPTPPRSPWLDWSDISYLDSGWRSKLVVQVDTFRTQIRVTGITIAEDPAHPESWTRDMRLQVWDSETETWKDGPLLLANSDSEAVRTHRFQNPVEGAKFRFVSTGGASWPVGNIRWGELVFHGEAIGPSHPDAVANRPVAVLFDEKENDLKSLMAYGNYPFVFRYDDAFSGGKSLGLSKAGQTTAHWRPPFGHVLPNWNFEVVENPSKPGEYRWLEFTWKAASKETQGLSLRVGPHHGGGLAFHAGKPTEFPAVTSIARVSKAPLNWQTQRIDLWELSGKPFSIRSLSLGAEGGGALFDRIRLGRTESDLQE